MADHEDILRWYLDDFLKLDRVFQSTPSPDRTTYAMRKETQQKKAAEILEMARGFDVPPPALQAWYKELGAQPDEQSRFGLALASSNTQTHTDLAQQTAYHYLQFEKTLASKREHHFTEIMQGFAMSRLALTEAIDKERPYFQIQRSNFENLKNALEGRWKQETLIGKNTRTPEWAAQQYLIFVYDQDTEREKEAGRLLREVLFPHKISPETIDAYLEKEGASAAERDHFLEAVTVAHIKEEKNRQVQAMGPHGMSNQMQLRLPAVTTQTPLPPAPPPYAEEYRREWENQLAAEKHAQLSQEKKAEIDRFIDVRNGVFEEYMNRNFDLDTPLPEPLTAEQARIKEEVRLDLDAERFGALQRSSSLPEINFKKEGQFSAK